MWRYLTILVVSIVIALFRYWPSDIPERVVGKARIIDGDSLRVNGEEIRLVGIDAPESRQTCTRHGKAWACGTSATRALKEGVGRQTVECAIEGLDKYDRLLAVCSRGERDLNAWMVEQGWAVSYGDYRAEEQRAREAQRGVWSGSFDQPKEWRDEHLTGSVAAAAS